MNITRLLFALVILAISAGCGGRAPVASSVATPATVTSAQTTATPTPQATLPRPTQPAVPLPTRVGADYVLLLPREAAIPAGWAMNPSPSYERRQPEPGDTYRFACRELTARSIGVARVGYRHLDGIPSIHIEYVVYPSDELAAAALDDMHSSVEACPEFTIGEGDSAIAAAFAPLDFPAYGDDGFGAILTTSSPLAGDLQTHAIKIRAGHVIIGINHATYAADPPPDAALTESLVALAVGNLEGGPAAPGE